MRRVIPLSPPFTRVAGKWLIIKHENPQGETRIAGSDSERRAAAARRAEDRMSGVILTYRDVLMPRSAGSARAASLSAISICGFGSLSLGIEKGPNFQSLPQTPLGRARRYSLLKPCLWR